jgi:hypothetical protein
LCAQVAEDLVEELFAQLHITLLRRNPLLGNSPVGLYECIRELLGSLIEPLVFVYGHHM